MSANPRVKALLLAGGLGTRLRPITNTVPKCLVPVAGKPMVDYWFDRLEAAEVTRVLMNTHHHAPLVREHLKKVMQTRPLELHEAYEPELLGSAGTVHANRAWADDADEVLIIYADNLSNVDLKQVLAFHRGHGDRPRPPHRAGTPAAPGRLGPPDQQPPRTAWGRWG